MSERFAPTVIIHGQTVMPEGWMWLLGYALAGCDWAIKQCDGPEFDLRALIKDYNLRRAIYFSDREIEELERRLDEARATRRKLDLLP